MKVADQSDLARLRHVVSPLAHDDERLLGTIVTLLRDGAVVATIEAADDALAFDSLRIVAGIRYKRENATWLDAETLPLAA